MRPASPSGTSRPARFFGGSEIRHSRPSSREAGETSIDRRQFVLARRRQTIGYIEQSLGQDDTLIYGLVSSASTWGMVRTTEITVTNHRLIVKRGWLPRSRMNSGADQRNTAPARWRGRARAQRRIDPVNRPRRYRIPPSRRHVSLRCEAYLSKRTYSSTSRP